MYLSINVYDTYTHKTKMTCWKVRSLHGFFAILFHSADFYRAFKQMQRNDKQKTMNDFVKKYIKIYFIS